MNAHRALSPSLDARIDRLLHERQDIDRSGRPRLIALTFDDGPYAVTTPLMLDALRDLHVKATFFLIGRDAEQFPELVRRIERDGNEIGNHTYSHPDLDELSPGAVRGELLRGRGVLQRFARDPSIGLLMRPPHGRYTEETVRVAQSLGYHVVLWTEDPGDWKTLTVMQIARLVEEHATAPSIVLLHSGKLATVQVLAQIVPAFRSNGYEFVTVGELLKRAIPEDINHPAKLSLKRG
ncbi:MAG: polysaccharide deacetylase family protein [Candidatus Eremiobacteraeota bacterium]|nr:polysaccharide deacetylase family protein [Candidatus Eremiobacteraeota bacterium]